MAKSLVRVSLRLHRLPLAVRYAITVLLGIGSVAYVYTFSAELPEHHYILVAPIAAACAVVLRTGILAAFVTAGLTYFALVEPRWTLLDKEFSGTVGLIAYMVCGFLISAVTDLLHDALQDSNRLSEELRQIAREINHRTKNNLMIIAALLQTESRELGRGETPKHVLDAAARRLAVVGRVHDLLFQEETSAIVQTEDFMHELCRSIRSGLLTDRIQLKLHVAAGQIAMSQATTIGLLVNELVTNAVKHAFPENEPGVIEIDLQCRAGDCILTVSDSGRGKPIGEESGFGSRMIATLVRQLNGEMQERVDSGTVAAVTFPLKPV